MITYRKAGLNDIGTVTALRMEMLAGQPGMTEALAVSIRCNTEQYTRDGFLNDTYRVWIAEEDSNIVSMGGICFFMLPPNDWCPGGTTAYIGSLYTVPGFRRRGIAKNLINLLMDEARGNSCERILLNATDMGRTLYEKSGFEPWPLAMAYYPCR